MKKVAMMLFVLIGFSLGASAHACALGSHKAKSTATTTPTTPTSQTPTSQTTPGSTGTSTTSAPAK